MPIILENLLTVQEVAQVRSLVSEASFVDGRGSSSLVGKNNLQVAATDPGAEAVAEMVTSRLAEHEAFQLAVQPIFIHRPMISLYEVGMEYPEHVDCALMGGRRADMAVTVFLSDLDSYDG